MPPIDLQKSQNVRISNETIIRFLLLVVLFFLIYYLRDLVLILLTSVVLASFVEAASHRMTRIGLNKTISVVLIYLISLSFLAGIFYLFVPILVTEASSIFSSVSKYLPQSDLIKALKLLNIGDVQDLTNNLSSGVSISQLISGGKVFSSFSGGFLSALASAFGGIINFILIVVVSFYLSMQEKGIEKFLRIVTPVRHEEHVIDLWYRSRRKIALWIRGQLVLGLLVGILVYIGLSILNVPYALVLSLTAAVLELIPFGLTLAAVPAIAFAYLETGITLALIVAIFYIVVQQLENYLIQPLVVKKTIGISPLVVIISVLIGSQLAGFWGFILAIPVAVAVLEYTDDVEKKKAAPILTA